MTGMDFIGMEPLPGGFSGETFVAYAAGERTVVRIYGLRGATRGKAAAEIDAAVLRLVRGLFPVPEVLEIRRPDAASGEPGILVTSFLPGERLDELLPRLDAASRGRVGRRLGRMIGRIGQIPMPRTGLFVDGDLAIEAWPDAANLTDFVEHQRVSSVLADWPDDLYEALTDVAERAQALLDGIERHCLVHSDLNPKNLLVDHDRLEVTGLLDWEFAHAGVPFADLGNLLRFDRDAAFLDGVTTGYLQVAGHLDGLPAGGRQRLLDLARAADLLAVTELAGRRGENPVADRADAQLRQVARTGDLHAVAE